MTCAAGIIGGVALAMDHLEDAGSNRDRSFRFELIGDRACSLLGGAVTIRCYRTHPVSQVRSTIKILRQSIRRIIRRPMRIFPGIGCRHLRRDGQSIDMDCLGHENGLLWLGGWRQLATSRRHNRPICPDRSERPSSSRPDHDRPAQRERVEFLTASQSTEGRRLRGRGSRHQQKRYRKNTHRSSSIRAAIQTRRDFPVNMRLAIPIHQYPCLSLITA